MRRVYKRPEARRDLIEHFVYLAEEAGEEVAEKFLTQAEQPLVNCSCPAPCPRPVVESWIRVRRGHGGTASPRPIVQLRIIQSRRARLGGSSVSTVGEVAERLNAPVLKTGGHLRGS
jgi:hypothetical protein